MKKKNKGFTLIELLAVIVILAIIALIVTPIILNIISESRDKSNQRSVEGLEHAIETTVGLIMLDDNYSGGDIICKNEKYMSDAEKKDISTTTNETYCWDVNARKETSKQVTYSGNRVVASTIGISMETGDIEVGNAQVGSSSKRYTTADKDSLYGKILNALNEAIEDGDTTIYADDYGNIRYRGSTPANYVTFNGETAGWRIIGIIDGKVKLIREDRLNNTGYSWDSSAESINSGYGINEWSQADLMKLLNPGYENETVADNGEPKVTGSLYWNSESGKCYNAYRNGTTNCDFQQTSTTKGLTKEAQNMIDRSTWYLGGFNGTLRSATTLSNILKLMDAERGTEVHKTPETTTNTDNDNIPRTTIWNGYVGLMYPSDYAQATNSDSCDENLYNWDNDEACTSNNWIYKEDYWQWTLSPYLGYASYVWYVYGSGYVDAHSAYCAGGVRPVINLKSSVKVTNTGNGTKDTPYKLG